MRFRKGCGAALLAAGLFAPPLAATAGRPELAVDNGAARRCFKLGSDARSATTTRFEFGGAVLALTSQEFRFVLADGREITPAELPLTRIAALPAEFGGRGVTLRFEAASSPFAVTVAYGAGGEEPWLTKRVQLSTRDAHQATVLLTEVEVERFTFQSGRFTGSGSGTIVRSDSGLFAALDHPLAECVVDGAAVVLRERPLRSAAATESGDFVWPWSSTATVGLDRSGAVAFRWLAGLAPPRSAQPMVPIAAQELKGPASELATTFAPRGVVAARLGPANTPTIALLDVAALARSSWFAPAADLPPGAIGAALAALKSSATPLALTVPLADAEGAPLPIASSAEQRTAKKALVALLQSSGQLHAPRWLIHEWPARWPQDATQQAQLAAGWIELFQTERKLCRDVVVALQAPAGTTLSPFWRRFVDVVMEPPRPLPIDGEIDAVAARFAAGAMAQEPLIALPPALTDHPDGDRSERLAIAAAGLSFWREAPAQGDFVPWLRENAGWRPQPFELPARAHGWLRLYPWCEWLEPRGDAPLAVEMAAGETALFVPLGAVDPSASSYELLPRPGRFAFGSDGKSATLLLAQGTTHSFDWFDRRERRILASARLGSAPAFQRRTAATPFAATLRALERTARGVRIEVLFATPRFRAEELRLRVAVEPPPATPFTIEAQVVAPADAVVPGPAHPASEGRFEWQIAETREPVTVAFELVGAFDTGATLLVAAHLVDTLDSLPITPPRALPMAPARPATPAAARRVTTLLLHDGPPPQSVVPVEPRVQGQ